MKKLKEMINSKSQKKSLQNKKVTGLFVLCFVVLFSVLSLVVYVSSAKAAVGINRQINFQGKLVDNNGLNVADSTYTVVFSLYSVSSGGSAVWTETDSVTTKAGIFQVALGATTSLPDNVYFNSDSLYLGIKVGSDAEMTPRIRFTAVPYAINAASLNGVTATQSANGFTLSGGTSNTKTLTLNDNMTFNNGGLTFANGRSVAVSGADITIGSTIQPTNAGGLTVDTNGANALSLGSSANSITFGGSNNPTYLFSGNGGLTVNGTSLILGNNANATIQTSAGSNAGLTLLSQGSGNITLGQNSGNGNVLIQPNAGGQAGLIINDQGKGDIFSASQGGTTKFTITGAGGIGLGTNQGSNGQCLISGGAGGAAGWAGCGATGSGIWSTNLGSIIEGNTTEDLLLGGIATTSAKFAFENIAGTAIPVASISAQSGTAPTGLSLGGSGAIQSLNLNTLTIGGATTGNIVIDPLGTSSVIVGQNAIPKAELDVRGTSGTLPVSSISGQTSFASLIINNSGSGDILSASSGGVPHFTIQNNGMIVDSNYTQGGGLFYTNSSGAFTQLADVTLGSCLNSGGTGLAPTWGTCDKFQNTWQSNGEVLSPGNLTQDLTFGATATSSAKFAILNMIGAATPTASVSAQNATNAALVLAGNGSIQSVRDQTLVLGGATTGDIQFEPGNASSSLYMASNGTVGLGTNSPLATLDIRGNTATTPAATVSASTTYAGFVIDNSGRGDILTASAGGVPHFTVQHNGTIVDSNYTQGGGLLYANNTGVFNQLADVGTGNCLTSAGAGSVPTWTNCATLGTNYWQLNNGTVSPFSSTADFLAGGTNPTATSSAGFHVYGFSQNGTNPVASISAHSSFAALVVNNTGSGDLFTASQDGATKFVVTNAGNVGIGTSVPTAGFMLDVTGKIRSGAGFNGLCLSGGVTFKTATTSNCNMDVAEIYPSTQDVTSGDVVMIDPTATDAAVKKADAPYVQNVMGIVTTHPGIILGIDGSEVAVGGDTTTYMQNANPRFPAIALSGKVPVKVSTQNGPIEPGDPLTASSIPGVAMKATQPGYIIGKALASDNDDPAKVGTVLTFVNISWYDPMVPTNGSYDLLQNTSLSMFDQSNNTASTSGVLNTYYTIRDGAGLAVTSTTALAKATVANIQAGAVVAKDISTSSLSVTTGNIMLGQQTLNDYIKEIVKQTLSKRDQTTSVAVSLNGLVTATQSAQMIQTMLSQNDLSATVSGMTITGTLGASTINVHHIAGLSDLTAASISAQIITADTIDAKHIAGLEIFTTGFAKDEARISALESLVASPSAGPSDPTGIPQAPTAGLALVKNDPTVQTTPSGDLRVKGNGLIEGILHVVDTLFANNFIANGVADFFGNVIFHNNVTIEGTPTVNNDTAGIAIIRKGKDHADVKFSKSYDQTPVVQASITLNPLTPTPSETTAELQKRQSELEQTLLADNIHFVITKRTVDGFTILLDKQAGEDIAFSWLALAVKNPVIFQTDRHQSPPVGDVSPSPIDSIIPKSATTTASNAASAGF